MNVMTDRILVPISAATAQRLHRLVEKGDATALDAIVDAALAGDPSTWRLPESFIPSEARSRLADDDRTVGAAVRCRCCPGLGCQNVFRWRGTARCACGSAHVEGSAVVQPNLDRK